MSGKEVICENCGENLEPELFECGDCSNQLCNVCANICKKCGNYFCDSCYLDHKSSCK